MERFPSLSPGFYKRVRKSLAKKLKQNSILVLDSNTRFRSNADAYYPYIRNSDFYYLTGLSLPDCSIVLRKDRKGEISEYLFIPFVTELKKTWDGEALDVEKARRITGIGNVLYQSDKLEVLRNLTNKTSHFFLPIREKKAFSLDSEKGLTNYINRHFRANIKESALPLIHQMRMVKQPEEIEAIREAISITYQGFKSILTMIRAGNPESRIESKLLHVFSEYTSRGFAFDPIIANGINSCTLHYINNSSILKKNTPLLLDIGAEFSGYNADITRVLPVGKFSKKHQQVFNAVLRTIEHSYEFYHPGTTIKEINKKVAQLIEQELLSLGLITSDEVENQNGKEPAFRRYFMHGAAHFLGLDVHDVGSRDDKLKPGMVLTLEPGIYVREWEVGVRLEQDVLITKEGCEVLSKQIPLEF